MKKVLSLMLLLVMLIGIVPVQTAFAVTSTATITVEATRNTVHPEEEIDFIVKVKQTGTMNTLGMELSIPSGLTYVPGSCSVPDNVRATLGWDDFSAVEAGGSITISGYGSVSYTSANEITVATFKCIADKSANGQYSVTLKEVAADDENYDSKNPIVNPANISVEKAPVPATGITLNKNSLALKVGESETLLAMVQPDNSTDTVLWTSSDSSVVAVDSNGKIVAVSKGNATITATAGDQFASCAVAVACNHNVKDISEKESTCTEQGWDAYKVCTICGQKFKMDGTTEITKIPFRPFAEHVGGTATCKEKAICNICHKPYGDYADHNYGILIPEIPAKCEVTGTKAHYKCSVCSKLFDENKIETTADALVIPALAHVPGEWKCDDTNHWKDCATIGCGVIIEITKENHVWNWVIDKEPTEDETGLKHEECMVCNYIRNENTVIPKLDHAHVLVKTEAKDATHEDNGNIEYYTCSACGKLYSDAEGKIEITLEETIVEALGHEYGESYTFDADNHWRECDCGSKIDVDAHEFGEWIVIKQATETETGIKERECPICGYKETIELPMIETTTDPTKPSNPGTSESPNTGDSSNTSIWFVILLFSALSMLAAIACKKKAKYNI